MDNKSNRTDIHEASFSSYLTEDRENFEVKLKESAALSHPVTTSSPCTSLPISLERNNNEEGEINVFDAEKYFNMRLDDGSPRIIDTINFGKPVHEKENQVRPPRMRPKNRLGTPSVSSEASCNSQTALLPSSMRTSSKSGYHQKLNDRWFFSSFGCNGSCADKKSVYIDNTKAHRGLHGKDATRIVRNPMLLEGRRQPHSRFQVEEELSSPSFARTTISSKKPEYLLLSTVNSGVQNLIVKKEEQKIIEEDPRKSLEVFGSHKTRKEDIAQNLERKLSVLTWDAIPESPNLPPNPYASSRQMYEDIESDASSDLFEIENISNSTQPIFTKQITDGMSGCMTPTSRYAPSEASIEWSVVTASAADFSGVPDYDEKMVAAESSPVPGSATTPKRIRANSLLGCKSQKAVNVAETVYKKNDKLNNSHQQLRRRPDIPMPPRKLQN